MESGKMGRLLNITNVSERVLDALLALAAGDGAHDFDSLTRRELIELADLSGRDLSVWIRATPAEVARRHPGADFEGMILDRQGNDEHGDGWGG